MNPRAAGQQNLIAAAHGGHLEAHMHGCRVQDSQDGPVPVVADQIYIYRDPSCANKAVGHSSTWVWRMQHIDKL